MSYLSTILISLLLIYFELSFLPYFKIFGVTPYIFLAFMILLSIRARWYFTYWVAFFGGLIFDFTTGSNVGIYVATFVFMAMISRALFFKKLNYLSIASYVWLMTLGTSLTFIFQAYFLYQDRFNEWSKFFFILSMKITTTLLAGLILYKMLDRYMDWLNKKLEERFR